MVRFANVPRKPAAAPSKVQAVLAKAIAAKPAAPAGPGLILTPPAARPKGK